MKTTTGNVLLAAGAIAQLASAIPHHIHHVREYVTDVVYETVVQTVTVGEPASSTSAAKVLEHFHIHKHSFHRTSSTTTDTAESTSSSSVESSSTADAYSASVESSSTADAYSASAYASSTEAPVASTTSSSTETSSTIEAYSPSSYASSTTAEATSKPAYTSTTAAAVSSSSIPVFSASSYYGSVTATSTAVQPTGSFGYDGVKAGLSGFPKITDNCPGALADMMPTIGWYSDYWPNTTSYTVGSDTIQGIPMLWGDGTQCSSSSTDRLDAFKDLLSSTDNIPLMFGFYEPDCHCATGSSDIPWWTGVSMWNEYLAGMPESHGTVLGSPSMCSQRDESWLKNATTTDDSPISGFDLVSIHINTNNMDDVKADVEYYTSNYTKPLWVSEFACVDASPTTWNPCTDQDEINTFINEVVPYFQCTDSIVAYGPSNGMGLSTGWAMIDQENDALSTSGQTYINAVKNVMKNGCAHYGY